MIYRSIIPLFILTGLLLPLHASEIKSFLSSSNIVKGEYTTLYIETKKELKSLPVIEDPRYQAEIYDIARTRNKQGNTVYHHKYKISSLITGTHIIPELNLKIKRKIYTTKQHTFHVFSADTLTFKTSQVDGLSLTYATQLFLPEKDLYLGENIPAELKVYLPFKPNEFKVVDQGLSAQKRQGFSAWPFQPSTHEGLNDVLPFLLPSGPSYALSYTSSAHAIQEGDITLGPGRITPIFKTLAPNGLATWSETRVPLPIAAITRKAIPLPDPAPATFDGAVGNYTFEVEAVNPDISSPSDPITIKLTVSGVGNLNEIDAPHPIFAPNSWRIYPAIRKQRDEERKLLSGSVEFEQIIRPTSEQSFIPIYKFSYFNPESKSYTTLESKPIQLSFKTRVAANLQKDLSTLPPNFSKNKSSAGSPPTSTDLSQTPLAKMEGVLDFISPTSGASQKTLSNLYWHIFPLGVTLYLLFLYCQKNLFKRLAPHPKKVASIRTLKRLQKIQDPLVFIKKAAFFAKTYLHKDKELRAEIEELRNNSCYLQDKNRNLITKSVRKSILSRLSQALKNTTFMLLFFCTCCFTESSATPEEEPYTLQSKEELAQKAYQFAQEGNYLASISTYLDTLPSNSVNTLYNIGTCYAKLQEPGLSMLFYRRALMRDSYHPESLQNLKYLIDKHHSIVPKSKGFYQRFVSIPRKTSATLSWVGIWCFVITLLTCCLIGKKSFSNLLYIIMGCSLLLALVMGSSIILASKEHTILKRDPIIIVTSPNSVTLKTSASHTASNVIKASPGSLGKVLEQRGLWLYVELANHTRGWLNSKDVASLSMKEETISSVPTVNKVSDI